MDLRLYPAALLALAVAAFAIEINNGKQQSTPQQNNVREYNLSRTQTTSNRKIMPAQDEGYLQSEEVDSMLMASAGRSRKNSKAKRGDDDEDDEDKKSLSQQIADGKYGLIEKEIYATTPKRPGIISYASNPEVPRDTAKNLGGLEPEEIWLAENHVLVLRGGYFPEHKFNRTDDSATAWPPIDPYKAPPRQVKIPANPKVPPPFPVQLTDNGPTQFIGFNGTAGPPPFPPFFPQPPPGNGSYFAPPFLFPPPQGNFTPGGGFSPPPGNGSFFPPPFPFPFPPPGNFTPGSGPLYPPPFPAFPPNSTIRAPLFPPPLPPNGSLPFPPPFLQNLPPGAAFLPPPSNLTIPFDEDDPSIYYPPPYDFFYPQDNSTEVPPGPLVPGIILPPPPNFFAPLDAQSDEPTTQQPKPPVAEHPPKRTYLPAGEPQINKDGRPSSAYLPVTSDDLNSPLHTYDDAINQVTPAPQVNDRTTAVPNNKHFVEYTNKPPRPPNHIVPHNIQVTHQGSSQPLQGYYYQEPQPPDPVYINNMVTTPEPPISYYPAPVTDIVVQPTPKIPQLTKQQRAKTKPATTLSPLVIFYNSRQSQNVESNTVTPTPQPYYVKAQQVSSTLPPIIYYTVPSAKQPTSVKTSYYFYEEPQNVYTTQATPIRAEKYPAEPSQSKPRARQMRPVSSIAQSERPPQYVPSRQRERTQQYLLSSILPLGQQVIYSSRPKIQYVSTTPSPQYYYVTASPPLQYNILKSSTASVKNEQVSVKPSPQPLVSNLAYFTTPRSNILSTQTPILYNIQSSAAPRPIYQYCFERSKNPSVQSVYTTARPRSRPTLAAVILPTTPRTLFEYSYEQQGLSTVVPQINGYYPAQYPQDVTSGSPTTHYAYDSREQNQQRQTYQSTPKPNYNRYQNVLPTANPLHAYFTQQDETLLDDITKKYFTIFGQKLQGEDEPGPTTPISPYTHDNAANRNSQYYTTPPPQYNPQRSGHISETGQKRPIALADDINVNYKKPLPPLNPFSEYVDTRQMPDSETGGALVSYKFPGDGGHFYFITPQIVGGQSQQPADGYIYSVPAQQPQLGAIYRRKKRKEQR